MSGAEGDRISPPIVSTAERMRSAKNLVNFGEAW